MLKLTVARVTANLLLKERIDRTEGSEFASEMLYLTSNVDRDETDEPDDFVDALEYLVENLEEGLLSNGVKKEVLGAALEIGWLQKSGGFATVTSRGRSRTVQGDIKIKDQWYWWNT